MEQSEHVDEVFRRLNASEAAVQPVAPSVAETASRLSSARLNLREWAEAALQRLQSSDVAMSVHAATSGGGGRVASVAALIGVCVSGVGAGTYCVATALLPDPKPAIRAEAKPAAKRKAQREAKLARLPSPASQAARATPTAGAGPQAREHTPHAPSRSREPRAGPDLAGAGGHPGLLVRADRRRSRTGHAGGRTIDRRRGVRTMSRRCSVSRVRGSVAHAQRSTSVARAGTYNVTACHNDATNRSWQSFRSNGFADTLVDCTPRGIPPHGQRRNGRAQHRRAGYGAVTTPTRASSSTLRPARAIVNVSGHVKLEQHRAAGAPGSMTRRGTNGRTAAARSMTWQPFNVALSTQRVSARRHLPPGQLRAGRAPWLRRAPLCHGDRRRRRLAQRGDGGWLIARWRVAAGVQDVVVSASDPVGVRQTRVLVDGVLARETDHWCDYAPCLHPCANGSDSLAVDTRTLGDGRHCGLRAGDRFRGEYAHGVEGHRGSTTALRRRRRR